MTEAALATEPQATPAPAVVADAPMSEDAAMDAVWDRLVTNNGADRENGRFVSPDPEKRAAAEAAQTAPLEGGTGEEQPGAEAASVADVPLPANWAGKDALWAKIPADVKADIAAFQHEQHQKSSDMGRKLAAYEPLNGVGQEVASYLQKAAERAGDAYDGPKSAAEGIAYLFNIQRMMDADAPGTLLQIMDTYGVRDKVAAALGVKAPEGQAQPDPSVRENALLAKIDRLEAVIKQTSDPSRIEQIIDQKTQRQQHDAEVSRLLESKPLAKEIDAEDMVFFIQKAWKALGPDAAKQAVFDHAYSAAIEASPTLRAKSQAATQAAKDAAEKAEAAKRGSSVNVKSTAQTGPRVQSEDDAMEEVWRKHHKG